MFFLAEFDGQPKGEELALQEHCLISPSEGSYGQADATDEKMRQ